MTFSVHTLGCKVNSCESAAITDVMLAAGYTLTDDKSDVAVVNSCAVTSMAVKKARQLVSRIKTDNPEAIVVLCGCFPQCYPEEATATDADIVIGNTSKADIPFLVGEYLKNRQKRAFINPLPREFDLRCAGTDLDRTRAFIKVEDGCDRFCTYCIIPTARGRVRSMPTEDITQQAQRAADSGHKEIVLTGINLSCYGQELDLTLTDAVKAADVEGIERIRLGSLEPDMMTDAEIKKLAAVSKLCPHFHLSLQSGSDEVLKRMRRRYDTKMYEQMCEKLRKTFPNCSITTDIMVGFTAETDAEFAESIAFAEKIGFAKLHVFPYSIRQGTIAAMRSGQVIPQVKSARAKQMTALARKLEQQFLASQVGTEHTVLIEKPQSAMYSNGFTESYIPVRIYNQQIERHTLAKVKIISAEAGFCMAELI